MKIEIIEIPPNEGGGYCAQDMDTKYRGDGETPLDAVKDLFELTTSMNTRKSNELQ